jgi:hypothetical protein
MLRSVIGVLSLEGGGSGSERWRDAKMFYRVKKTPSPETILNHLNPVNILRKLMSYNYSMNYFNNFLPSLRIYTYKVFPV